MNELMDRALTAIGTWHQEKVRKYYTPDVERTYVQAKLRELEWAFTLTPEIEEDLRRSATCEHMLVNAQQFFRTTYAQILALRDSPLGTGGIRDKFSSGMFEEYVQPLIEHTQQVSDMVLKVAKRIQEKPDCALSEKEMDRIFSVHFSGLEGYVDYTIKTHQLASFMNYALAQRGAIPRHLYEVLKDPRIYQSTIFLQRVLFKDLKTL